MENLQSAFQCLVCFGPLENAHLCPSCSKFYCYSCILKWIEDHAECPHCRSRLTRVSLERLFWFWFFNKVLFCDIARAGKGMGFVNFWGRFVKIIIRQKLVY